MGVDQFLVFEGDRAFFIALNGRRLEWGAPAITGSELKWLAGVDPANQEV
jgi:hypothetical protein